MNQPYVTRMRKSADMSRSDLAHALSTSVSTIRNWEMNGMPSSRIPAMLDAIAARRASQVAPDDAASTELEAALKELRFEESVLTAVTALRGDRSKIANDALLLKTRLERALNAVTSTELRERFAAAIRRCEALHARAVDGHADTRAGDVTAPARVGQATHMRTGRAQRGRRSVPQI